MTQTPAQAAAEANLEQAIRDLMVAYDSLEGLVIDWVIMVAEHVDDGEGTTATAVSHWVAEHQPLYRSLGLLNYGVTRLDALVAGNADASDR